MYKIFRGVCSVIGQFEDKEKPNFLSRYFLLRICRIYNSLVQYTNNCIILAGVYKKLIRNCRVPYQKFGKFSIETSKRRSFKTEKCTRNLSWIWKGLQLISNRDTYQGTSVYYEQTAVYRSTRAFTQKYKITIDTIKFGFKASFEGNYNCFCWYFDRIYPYTKDAYKPNTLVVLEYIIEG